MQRIDIVSMLKLEIGRLSAHIGRCFRKLVAPLLDLVLVHIELMRQLDQCLIVLDRGHSRCRLECRAMVLAISSYHGLLFFL